MDQNSDQFLVQKEALQKELLNLMIQALEKNLITVADSQEASRFIVEEFEKAEDIYYLKAVVENLAADWPCFSPALTTFSASESKHNDEAKIAEAEQQLKALQNQTN